MTEPNPTIDEAFEMCFSKMDAGAPSVFVHPLAHAALKARYYKSFYARLQDPSAWSSEGPKVLQTAFQLGSIAESIAHLHGSDVVDENIALRAGAVVESECDLRFGSNRGRWCTTSDATNVGGTEAERELDAFFIKNARALRENADRTVFCEAYKAGRGLILRLVESIANPVVKRTCQFLMKIADGCCGASVSS